MTSKTPLLSATAAEEENNDVAEWLLGKTCQAPR